MIELFLFDFFKALSFLKETGIFVVSLGAIVLSFIVCLLVSIFKEHYSIKKRLWLIVLNLGILTLEAWAEKVVGSVYNYTLFNAGISIILFSIVLSIREKNKKLTKEQKDFVKYLDNCVKKEPDYHFQREQNFSYGSINQAQSINDYTPLRVQPAPRMASENTGQELDFSHVKAILNKLEYYSISNQDKRQASELENLIITAETNGLNQELKEKINDGLGALLKIMSKYAI